MTKKPFNVLSKASLAGILAVSALVPVAAASAATNYTVDEIVVAIDGKNVTVSKEVYDAAIAEGWMAGKTISHVQNSDGKYYSKAVLDEAVSEAATLTEALGLLADSDKAVTITTVPGKFVAGTLVPEEQVVAGLKVESVSAIDETGVEVTVTAADEDRFDQTIEVTDNKGNKVEVKPATIAAGETSAYFEFVTTATKQEGTWNIAGQKYDFDLAANLETFKDADTQIGLNKALADLGINNVKAANVPTYLAEKADFLADLDGDLTTDAIQTWVDKVNTDVASGVDKVEAEKAATKAVVDALKANNDIALLSALQNDVFKRVNPEWVLEYKAGFFTGEDGALVEPANAAAVQAAVNGVNEGKVKAANAIETTIVDKTVLAKEKALLEKYATPDAEGKQTENTKAALEAIEVQSSVADVLAATTPNTLKTRVAALAKLTDSVNLEKYIDTNGKYYLDGFGEGEDAVAGLKGNTDVKGATAINTLLGEINEAVSGSYTETVKNADSADDLLKALKAYPGLKNVADSNKAFYFTPGEEDGDGNQFAEATSEDIQETVDAANVAAVAAEENTADQLLTALKVVGVKNVTDSNKAAYAEEKTFFALTPAQGNPVNAIQAVVNATNALVNANSATTSTQLRSALTTFAVELNKIGVEKAPAYINLSNQAKLEVADIVLEGKEKNFANATELAETANEAMKAHTAILTSINGTKDAESGEVTGGINAESSITAVDAALSVLDYDAYNNLDDVTRLAVAQAFLENLPTDDEGAAVDLTYKTIAEITADIDKAIAKPAVLSAQ